MSLMLFNSRSGRKERFEPMHGREVKIYVCGITPYDTTHLGHAFTYSSFDTLIRYLSFKGYGVTYTQNVTDIDDDILRKARESKEDWRALGERWTNIFLADTKSINIMKPTYYVKATESIDKIKEIIAALLDKKIAYASKGNVYFNVKKFKKYGQLSRLNERQMKILLKERGGDPDDPGKKNPLDFILWQKRGKGEPYWKAEWGDGRPGWHIECSAMINQYLGNRIDIHGGGRDLVFPHHESEIAQSESFTGKEPFAKYFMHTAMVMDHGEKMSKSLGNLVLVSDLLKRYSPNAIRWMLLSHHYRSVWEYNREEMEDAERFSRLMKRVLAQESGSEIDNASIRKFTAAMNDDLGTEQAISLLKELLKKRKNAATIRYIASILGFFC